MTHFGYLEKNKTVMWLFAYNHVYFGYIHITTLTNKNTFGVPYYSAQTFYSLLSSGF